MDCLFREDGYDKVEEFCMGKKEGRNEQQQQQQQEKHNKKQYDLSSRDQNSSEQGNNPVTDPIMPESSLILMSGEAEYYVSEGNAYTVCAFFYHCKTFILLLHILYVTSINQYSPSFSESESH